MITQYKGKLKHGYELKIQTNAILKQNIILGRFEGLDIEVFDGKYHNVITYIFMSDDNSFKKHVLWLGKPDGNKHKIYYNKIDL